jgi:hypothetical protein
MTDAPAADRVVTSKDNNPPAYDAFSMALDDAYSTAKDFLDGKPIENQGQADRIGTIVGEVKRIKKDAEEARKAEKEPHLEASRAVDAKWRPLAERADTILTAAQAPLTAYLHKLAEEQRAQETKLREEAARAAQEAIEAQRAAPNSIEAVERARGLEKAADKAAKEAARAGKAKAHVTGMDRAIGLRTYKVATVVNHRMLLNWIAANDAPALRAFLEEYARKALPMQPPGVEVTEERKVA